MSHIENITRNEEGYALVVALMIMAILSLIGVFGINTSIIEQQIAGNEWNAKRTFYHADGGASLGSELLEQSFACAEGFNGGIGSQAVIENTVLVREREIHPDEFNNLRLWINPKLNSDDIRDFIADPDIFDAAFPSNAGGDLPGFDVGYLYFGGETRILPGGALQMAAGYEGKGKSAGQGGSAKEFDIYSQFLGPKRSESIIVTGWRHLIGSEGNCLY